MFIASLENAGLRSSALLMCVLSLHSFLAGLAFGSQPDPAEEFKVLRENITGPKTGLNLLIRSVH